MPDNVVYLNISIDDFNILVKEKTLLPKGIRTPYKLCDFKPLYGTIFQDYLEGYDFWGHIDLDVIWGDIRSFITEDMLSSHDIISAYKYYVSGHFALYRNNEYINDLYKKYPDYLKIFSSDEYKNFDETLIYKIIKEEAERSTLRASFDQLAIYPDFSRNG
jgi:hypothetical protein